MTKIATEIAACRLCGSNSLVSVLDFGTPYISDFLDPGQEGVRAPLHAVRCEACGLVQLRHTVDRDLLYADHYWYRSGMNESMVKALGEIVDRCQIVEPGDWVLDIGANDGTLLKFWPKDVHKVAVEPAPAFRQALEGITDRTLPVFWPPWDWRDSAFFNPFKIITTVACFYDADDPHAFVEAIRQVLHPRGLWIVQMQDELSVLRTNAVDYFCHEHLCLYSAETFESLCNEHGLRVLMMQANQVNGGSLRFVVGHQKPGTAATNCLPTAREDGARQWHVFAESALRLRDEGRERLRFPHYLGVAASTKANTTLQWYEIDSRILPAIIDRDPAKIGKLTVGSGVPIISEMEAANYDPDYYVALAWHFLDGFRQRYPDVPFLTLLPEVKTYPAWNTEVRRSDVTAQATP